MKEDSEKEKNKIYQTDKPTKPPTIGSTTAQLHFWDKHSSSLLQINIPKKNKNIIGRHFHSAEIEAAETWFGCHFQNQE